MSLMKLTKDELRNDFDTLIKAKIAPKLASLKKFLGKKEFLLGYLTLADFELAHCIELMSWICIKCGLQSPFEYF